MREPHVKGEWSQKEDRRLLAGWEDGLDVRDIARRLRRRVDDTRGRLLVLLGNLDRLPNRQAGRYDQAMSLGHASERWGGE